MRVKRIEIEFLLFLQTKEDIAESEATTRCNTYNSSDLLQAKNKMMIVVFKDK